jgi:hypothetical protein
MAADPQLHMFGTGGAHAHIVTTDGELYWVVGCPGHPVADPGGAARTYARWWHVNGAEPD